MSATIQLKDTPETLYERLRASAKHNFRRVDQEALSRLERSFALEDALVTCTHQNWVDEALAGEFRAGSVQRLRKLAAKARAAAA
jgi:heme oxygenase